MSAVDPVKPERYGQSQRQQWTEQATVSAWRKWQAPLAAFIPGATDTILEAAHQADSRTVSGRWLGLPEPYWQQLIEVAAPFCPLVAKLTPEARARGEEEIFVRGRFCDGSEIPIKLAMVVGTGIPA